MHDFEVNRSRHVAASLSPLPFADRSFDRVLAANFLFTYAHTSAVGLYDGRELDLDFRLKSVDEIACVARREIRLAPMGSFDPPPRPHAYRDAERARLEQLGWRTELVTSAYRSGLRDFNDILRAQRGAQRVSEGAAKARRATNPDVMRPRPLALCARGHPVAEGGAANERQSKPSQRRALQHVALSPAQQGVVEISFGRTAFRTSNARAARDRIRHH